jgi:hypothetical protein
MQNGSIMRGERRRGPDVWSADGESLAQTAAQTPENGHRIRHYIPRQESVIRATTALRRDINMADVRSKACNTSQCSARRPSSNRTTSAAIQAAGLPIPVKRPCATT